MSDIVDRLREQHYKNFPYPKDFADVVVEAADEIEALRKKCEDLKADISELIGAERLADAEIDRVRRDLESLRKEHGELVTKLWDCLVRVRVFPCYNDNDWKLAEELGKMLPPRKPRTVTVPWHEAIEMLRDGRAKGAENSDGECIHWRLGCLVKSDGEYYTVWKGSIGDWTVELADGGEG